MKFLLLFGTFMAGNSLALATYGKKAEQTILLSVFEFTGIAYIFGIFGFLRTGFYACCAFSAFMWVYAIYRIFTKRNLRRVMKNIFTPASFLFAAAMGLYTFSVVGLRASQWDEFSHWAKSVKIMFFTDALCSRPGAGTGFETYPPAVGIFQYILMNLNGEYVEWILYFGYALIVFAAVFYFASEVSFGRTAQILVCFFAVMAVILTYDAEFLLNLQVDLLVSVLTAFCISHILCFDPAGNRFQNIVLSAAMAFAVLVKEAGIFFVRFSCAAYILFFFIKSKGYKPLSAVRLSFLFPPLIAAAAAQISWKTHIFFTGATGMFDGKYDIAEFVQILLGKQVGYRNQVLENFLSVLFNFSESYKGEVQISYGLLILMSLALLYAVIYFLAGRRGGNRAGLFRVYRAVAVCALVYPVGLLASYMYKFSEYEALSLASFYRYMNIDAVALVLICIFAGGRYFITSSKNCRAAMIFAASFAFLLSNNNTVRRLLSREYVSSVARNMQWADEAVSGINTVIQQWDNVAVIDVQGGGYESICMGYRLWPAYNSGAIPINITTKESSADDDEVTGYTVEKLINDFEENRFDYLLLARADDDFASEYAAAFANPQDIQTGNAFYLDDSTRQFVAIKY